MTLRDRLVALVVDYLQANYAGPISIRAEREDEILAPPYAVVRVSTAEPLYPGEPIWDVTVLIGVSQDADLVSATSAEEEANELFELLTDPTPEEALVGLGTSHGVAVSAVMPIDSQATTEENRWLHVLGMRFIAARSQED